MYLAFAHEHIMRNSSSVPHLNDASRLPTADPLDNTDPKCLFRSEPINFQTLVLTITHMNNYARWSDGIPLRFLNDSLPIIIPYLTTVMNTSIITGIFPGAWKYAIVVAILKTGDGNVNDPSNYRPISLLPVLSKLLEKLFHLS